ncbi:unnamed protein product [Natator depressus]
MPSASWTVKSVLTAGCWMERTARLPHYPCKSESTTSICSSICEPDCAPEPICA